MWWRFRYWDASVLVYGLVGVGLEWFRAGFGPVKKWGN